MEQQEGRRSRAWWGRERGTQTREPMEETSPPAGRSLIGCPVPDPCGSTTETARTFQVGSQATGDRMSRGLGKYGRHLLGAARNCCSHSGCQPRPGSTSPPVLPSRQLRQNLKRRGNTNLPETLSHRQQVVRGWLDGRHPT